MNRFIAPARTMSALVTSVALLAGLSGTLPAAADTSSRWAAGRTSSTRRVAHPPQPSYAVESKLTANAILVHRATLTAFPQVKTFYGYRNDPSSDHYQGKALDLMLPDYKSAAGKALGTRIAAWAQARQPGLHIQYIIWNQHIWNVSRASEGWRPMADRGSDSANHKNHVHISVQ